MAFIFRWPGLARPAEDHPEPPPRPQQQERGPVTVPRLWAPCGPLDARFDPCGAPPIGEAS
jgi:hypothetical protein